ncbi:hypothetical protein G3O08_11945 [Cryomorpha ignava]|uniref:Uncharacterized protein n=1 Tax=Cryomorpha ignava TaxID=101383 RepID=A0A7K3WRV2_9FLAO|nr:hypothetical protein [Cryomorpha ignava]NEN24214.1 hypothetical protein [Cryomorpha ignava]
MKKNKRLKLKPLQTLTHYGIVLFLLFIVSLTAWSLIQIHVTDTYTGVRTSREIIRTSLPFLLLALFFAFIQYRRLKFKEIDVTFSDEQFQEAVDRTARELKWSIERNNKNFLRAYRSWNWTASWGEMVTIAKDKDRLFVNSICSPESMSSVASFGWNRKNISTFLENLTAVKNGKPEVVKIERVKSEWSLKRVLIRLLAYPFCISLIILGIYMISQSMTVRAVIAGIAAITIACIYLYSDIKIMTTKNNKRRNPNR